ncbi:MAG: YceI family protein [Bacteroidetes bacterium]|jgi:polyisoprenoid-binding protein YceI|nr:YceI family protein [Bacteroidota bacterium]
MTIIKQLLYFICFGTFFLSAQKTTLNIERSTLKWKGEQITSKTHYGSLKFVSGELSFDKELISSGKFIVDMTSLTVEDLVGSSKKKLEGHLKSDDFFSVSSHNKAKLTISSSVKIKANTYLVEGDLTIKNILHPVQFTIQKENTFWIANLVFDRSKYNVQFRSGNFFENLGDKLILDSINLDTTLFFN